MLQKLGPSPRVSTSATRQSSLLHPQGNHIGKPDQAAEPVSRKNFRCWGKC